MGHKWKPDVHGLVLRAAYSSRPGTVLALEDALCRTQQTSKYEPAPINFGSKPGSPKVGKMSSDTRFEQELRETEKLRDIANEPPPDIPPG